jgi:glycosyltransferase involved in cell wall biosynthesis
MSTSPASRTLVIVPTYNEADTIATLVTAIFQATPAVDILFVDDHSQDGTQDKITLRQHQYGPKVHLLSRAGKVDGGGTRHWSIVRQCISKAGALYARWLLGLPIQDPTSGYNVWHRRVLEAIDFKAVQRRLAKIV